MKGFIVVATVIFALSLKVEHCFGDVRGPDEKLCSVEDKSFDEFFSRFTENTQVQEERVVIPLVIRSFSTIAQTEPNIKIWDRAKLVEEIRKTNEPLVYSEKRRLQLGIAREFLVKTKSAVEVFYHLPEADTHQTVYVFRKVRGCWFLEEVRFPWCC